MSSVFKNIYRTSKKGGFAMTANQLSWANLQEERRHHAITEEETSRNNKVTEKETGRANRAREKENTRSNKAKEKENKRSNKAREKETHRANVAKEAEDYRSHLANEQLGLLNYGENVRTNQANEAIRQEGNYLDYEVGSRNAASNERNAASNAKNADTNAKKQQADASNAKERNQVERDKSPTATAAKIVRGIKEQAVDKVKDNAAKKEAEDRKKAAQKKIKERGADKPAIHTKIGTIGGTGKSNRTTPKKGGGGSHGKKK